MGMSGVTLNLCVCGMLFRPLTFTDGQRNQMMLEEFERMSPGNAKTAKKARSRCSSGNSLSSCEDSDVKALSALNLPSFVEEHHFSNKLLMEAVKNSSNPNKTLHRYLKNLQMQSEHTHNRRNPDKIKIDQCNEINTFKTTNSPHEMHHELPSPQKGRPSF